MIRVFTIVACLALLGTRTASAECSDIQTPQYCSKQICSTCYNQGHPYQCSCYTNNYICGYSTRQVCSNSSGGGNILPPRAPPTIQDDND
jgi:hypothetical protein